MEAQRVWVWGSFDDIRSGHIRFLQEVGRLGLVTVLLVGDEEVLSSGETCKFGFEERRYFLEALSWVDGVEASPPGGIAQALDRAAREGPGILAVTDALGRAALAPSEVLRSLCRERGLGYASIGSEALGGFPYEPPPMGAASTGGPGKTRKKAIATGTFDWLHTGHLRFFEEASAFGELTVVVGHDDNIRLLKGEGHPLLGQAERRYVVGSVRHVARALISSGSGWLDAEPEIEALGPDLYVVNEDGDRGDKRGYCEAHGIEYIVLRRVPKDGLPRRASTDLRGF